MNLGGEAASRIPGDFVAEGVLQIAAIEVL